MIIYLTHPSQGVHIATVIDQFFRFYPLCHCHCRGFYLVMMAIVLCMQALVSQASPVTS